MTVACARGDVLSLHRRRAAEVSGGNGGFRGTARLGDEAPPRPAAPQHFCAFQHSGRGFGGKRAFRSRHETLETVLASSIAGETASLEDHNTISRQ